MLALLPHGKLALAKGPMEETSQCLPPPMLCPAVCILGALQRQVDLQGVFVKIGDSIKFKGFLVSSKNQTPPENRPKSGLF